MRPDFDDRILDYALERTLGAASEGDATQTELSERILRAWSRGAPGSLHGDELPSMDELQGAEPESNGFEARPRPVRRSRRLPLLAAAAAVLLLLALARFMERGPLVQPFAVASSGLEIHLGDVVRVDAQPLDLRLANGAELRVSAGTVLQASERGGLPAFELELGSLELRTGREPCWITAEFAGVRALAQAELTVRVERDPQGKRALSVNVTRGAAEFEHAGVVLTVVPAPGPRMLAGSVLLDENDIERFDALFKSLCLQREIGLYEPLGFSTRILAMEELSAVLARSVPLWARLASGVDRWRDDPTAELVLGNVIDFLHTDSSPAALALASELWLEVPEWFTETHLVTFAERGAFEFQRELEAMVEMYEAPAEPLLAFEPGQEPPILAATYLALRGNDAGRELLAGSASTIESRKWVAPWGMLAALGLHALGDYRAWDLLEQRVQSFVKAFLAEHELRAASRTLLQLEYFRRLRDDTETPFVGTVQMDAIRWVEVRSNEIQTEQQVLELLRELCD